MEPKIVQTDSFMVVGMPYLGKNEHGEISEMWGEFNRRAKEIPHVVREPAVAYGLCFPNSEGVVDYVAGLPVSTLAEVPEGMVGKQVPAQTYVVFEAASIQDIMPTYGRIEQWLKTSGYQAGNGPDFEYYPPEFDPSRADTSPLCIYFPIVKA